MRRLLVCLAACADDPGWGAVENPIAGFDDVAIKDAFLTRGTDGWQLGYSEISDEPFRFRLGFASSSDLGRVERQPVLDQPDTGGLASPSVTRAPDGRFVMTYNSHTADVDGALNKLYYRTSTDLLRWSDPQRIHVDGADTAGDRLIDATVAFTDAGAFLVFKRGQIANAAYSASGSLDGPWELLGPLKPRAIENGQLIAIDGTWHLLATTIPLHAPVLHRLAGDPRDPRAWLEWEVVRELAIPAQPWNDGELLAHERANAAFLVDDRETDGVFYVIYAGSIEVTSFEGRGHSSLGIARSVDLEHWEVPPAR